MNQLFAVFLVIVLSSCGGGGEQENDAYYEKLAEKKVEKELFKAREEVNQREREDLLSKAKVFAANNNHSMAVTTLNRVIEMSLNPHWEYHVLKAEWQVELKEYQGAIQTITECILNDYDLKNTYYLRSLCYVKLQENRLAAADLREAIERKHPEAEDLYNKINPEKKRVAYYVTRCCDGSTSDAKGRGACSHHGGVCNWNDPVYETYREY